VRSGSVVARRTRFALGLTIVGAVLLMAGLMMILAGETLRLKSTHSQGLVAAGEIAAICGLACGLALLVVLIAGPADRSGRRRDAARVVTGWVVTGPVVTGPVVAGDMSGSALSPLPPAAGFVPPGGAAARAGPAGATCPAPGYTDEGWHPQPDERRDPQAERGWSPRPAPGWLPQAEGGWSQGQAYAWHPAGPDDWDGGQAHDWDGAEAEDWIGAEAEDWEGGEAGDWGRDGHGEWIPDGQDDWGPDAWAHQGGDAWVPDGRGGWMPQGQVPVGQEGWTGRPGQVPGGQTDWAEPAGEQWAPDDQDVWVPDGRGSWTHPAEDDWARAAAAAPYPASAPDGRLDGLSDRHLDVPADGHQAGGPPAHLTGPDAPDDEDRSADDDDTAPIPVILAGAPGPPPSPPEPFSVWEPTKPRDRRPDEPYRPEHAEPPGADTQEKIEEIKDLYETAEAIGEEALVRNFEQLKTRQRWLIREFFEKAGLGPGNSAHSSQHADRDAAGDSAPDGASLPR
jgi:hypothetical protein